MKKLGKRGMSAPVWVQVVLGLAGAIIFVAVMAIVLSAFGSATSDANATAIIGYGKQFLYNASSQLPTVGTVAGVLLLVGLLALSGLGAWGVYQRYR